MESYFPDLGSTQTQLARERVLADLRALTADSEALLKATAHDVGEAAVELRGRLGENITRARQTIATLQARGVATVRAAARETDTAIRAHPYRSLGVAFGVGVLLGIFLNRD